MKKKNIFLWVLLFIFLTTYNLNLEKGPIDSFFHIKKVEIDGIKNSNLDEIQERLKIFNEENLITIDPKKIITVIADLDFVRDIKIKKTTRRIGRRFQWKKRCVSLLSYLFG